MKLVLMSDLHLLLDTPRGRLDDTHETQKRKLGYVLKWCMDNNAELLQAGDFFHKPRRWYIASAWMEFISEEIGTFRREKETNTFIHVIFGQHDTHMYHTSTRKATALGLLESAGVVEILQFNPVIGFGHTLYGCSYGQEVPEVEDRAALNILVIHKMIVDKKIWAGQEDCIYAPEFLNTHRGFDLILCGDMHKKFKFTSADGKGRIICNTGPMTRYEATEYNFRHAPGFFVYETKTRKIKWHEIPHEPADRVLTREHLEKEKDKELKLDEFVEAVKGEGVDAGVGFKENLRALVEREGVSESVKGIVAKTMDEEG